MPVVILPGNETKEIIPLKKLRELVESGQVVQLADYDVAMKKANLLYTLLPLPLDEDGDAGDSFETFEEAYSEATLA